MNAPTPLAAALAVVGLATSAAAASPATNYTLHCHGCHLADGSETAGAVPALKERVGLFLLVPGGREFLIRVPGLAQSPLDDAALAELINWLIEYFGPVAVARDFTRFTGEEVTRHRYPPLADVESVRRQLLERIEELEPL